MPTNEPVTGTRDELYDLVSLLHHGLQAADTLDQYRRDTSQASDEELTRFVNQALQDSRARAEQAKKLLAARLH